MNENKRKYQQPKAKTIELFPTRKSNRLNTLFTQQCPVHRELVVGIREELVEVV